MLFSNLVTPILNLPRVTKIAIVLLVDISFCILSVWFAFYLRIGQWVTLSGEPMLAVVASLVFALPIFMSFGLYRAVFRYSGWAALLTIIRACAVYSLLFATLITAFGFPGIPRTIGIIQPILLLLLVGFSRAFATYWLGSSYRGQIKLGNMPRVLIYGAGAAGRQLAAALRNSHQMRVVGFLDDDVSLWRQSLNGITIHKPSDLPNLAASLCISDVLLALPSINRTRRNAILSEIAQSKVAVRTLPSLIDLAKGKVTASDLRELDVADLLGREPVSPDLELLKANIFAKVVLVTGAGGSIGSELCRQILLENPSRLILLDQSEYALYLIEQELQKTIGNLDFPGKVTPSLVPVLGSVRNEKLVKQLFNQYSPHIIFHAAAYKHVPLVEANFSEGILNNTFGTLNFAKLAGQYKIAKFILISTDKAVRPTNVMGASKRLAEMTLQALAADPIYGAYTIFSMVRFGNVLDSSGSVVPLFRQQIASGGPLTLTDLEVTRYFMTIPEAAQLVLQAGAMATGGDVFVLDMGDPVKIADLARLMIELSGLQVQDVQNPDGDIEIQITGLRPGEKLYEELLIGNNPQSTSHPRIMRASEDYLPLRDLEQALVGLEFSLHQDSLNLTKECLKKIVLGYQPI
ncbi:polysaccharide biosynthesis protein [Polynucleobacter paneuropaeus]|nr:polysaccharide biosynthesis protein [Polynucleobacter paneuropaeus]MBT8583017.1 polysaccharide biosynthesis protein [Polynucleobacter paneuropaeus]